LQNARFDNRSRVHLRHVKETLSHPGCARAALKYYTGLRSFDALGVMFSQCHVPALQLAGRFDGCMGVDVRRHTHAQYNDVNLNFVSKNRSFAMV
jgi:hypothetical protein